MIAVHGKGNSTTVTVGVLTPGKFTPLNVPTRSYLGPEPGAIAF